MNTVPVIFGVWTPVKPTLLRNVHDRLSKLGGCSNVRYAPSKIDANEVVADVDPVVFLEREYSTSTAHLRVEFNVRGERTNYWIQWWEPDAGRSIGWHCDDTEPEYGPVHFQVEYPNGAVDRERTEFVEDEHPYRTFERILPQISERLSDLEWE